MTRSETFREGEEGKEKKRDSREKKKGKRELWNIGIEEGREERRRWDTIYKEIKKGLEIEKLKTIDNRKNMVEREKIIWWHFLYDTSDT